MKIPPYPHAGFWTQTIGLILISLWLMLLPDWGHELRAQSLSPASYNFATVAIGSSKTTTFTVQNSFTTAIDLSGLQTSGAPFAVVNNCPGILAQGAFCSLDASFAPTSAGSFTGTLSVTWAPNGVPPPPPGEPPLGGTLTAALTGNTSLKLTAVPDTATTPERTAVTIPVLDNDTGGTKPLSIIIVTSPSHGIATISGSAIRYIPTAGYSGPDSFGYTVRDSTGQTSSTTVAVTVTSPKPTAVADRATTSEGKPVSINVLNNDTGGTQPLSISAVTAPAHGTASISGTAILYTPAPGYSGTDRFGYTVEDAAGQTSSTTVTVTVTPLLLVAVADSATTPERTTVTIPVLDNDIGGNKPLSISVVTSPSHGIATISGSAIRYIPTAGYSGPDSFGYTVRDSTGQTSSTTVAVTVTPLKLIAVADSATTAADKAVSINVLNNDTGGTQPLSISAVTSPAHGTATISGNAILYTPTVGYSGPDSFGYTVRDANGQTASTTVSVTVTPNPLIAVTDSATTAADKAVSINVLNNDTGGTQPLSVSVVTSPAHGTATISGNAILYTPTVGYAGPDSFGYTVRDANGQTASTTVSVTVTPNPLIAVADSATTAADKAVSINVLNNDTGGTQPLSISAVTSPAHGTATISGNAILYTPTAGYSGPDSFGYTVRDATGQTASTTVSVTVTPNPLIAVTDSATTPADKAVSINVLNNDTGGTQPLSVSVVTSPAHGTATISGNAILYTPTVGYSGPDSFGYTVRDANGQTASTTVSITVTPNPLIAVTDSATTAADKAVSINVLNNDTGGTQPLSVSAVTSPAHGTATISGNAILYTPTVGYSGLDSFGYTVKDAAGQTASTTVSITVTSNVLIAVPDSAATAPGKAVSINVLNNDTGGTPPLRISAVTIPAHGTATISGNAILYTPTAGYSGPDGFSYTVRDATGQTDSTTVSVTVTSNVLIAVPDSATTAPGKAVSINVLNNDTGGTQPLSLSAVTAPAHGTATISGNAILYTPTAGYSGPDGFSYTVRDATGQTASTTVTVKINPGQDPVTVLEEAASDPNAAEVGGVVGGLCGDQAANAEFLRDCNALVDAANSGDPAASAALDQITPDTASTAPAVTATNAKTQMVNIQSRLSSLRSGIMGIDIERLDIKRGGWTMSGRDLRYLLASVDGGGTPSAEVTPASNFGGLGIFASGSLNFGNRDTTENQTGFDFRALVLALGMDYRFTDQLVLGTAFSYVDNQSEDVGNSGSLDTRGYSLALYGTYYQSDQFYLDGIIDYGWNDYDQQRKVVYQLPDAAVNQNFTSQYGGNQLFVDIGAGYNFTHGNLTFGPRVRFSYLDMQVDSFQEQVDNDGPGSGWAVAIEEQSLQSLVSKVGGRASYLIDQPWGVLQPQVELSWLHEFKDHNRQVQGWFVQGATVPDNLFYLLVDPGDPDYFELGLGASARFNKGPVIQLQYRTLFGYDHLNQHSIGAQFRWEF